MSQLEEVCKVLGIRHQNCQSVQVNPGGITAVYNRGIDGRWTQPYTQTVHWTARYVGKSHE